MRSYGILPFQWHPMSSGASIMYAETLTISNGTELISQELRKKAVQECLG